MPYSFDNQEMRWAVDIREYTLEKAWKSRELEDFEIALCDRKDNM